ncbi:MAG: ABC transporter ATP-binding protein [Actinomycetota bacterium]|nr:ABC transporter ATP-binding protein [Actinomycetota bacterium]
MTREPETDLSAFAATSVGPLIEAVDVRKQFGDTVALDGLSFEIAGGEIVAVLGPSGSGKSTLLLCLAGILLSDGGDVRYRGRSLASVSDAVRTRLRRDDFGFVFQFGQLVPELTALDNVSLPLRLAGLRRRDAIGRAREFLASLGVDDVAEKRAGEMSGGQAQRVAVARALVSRPRVIFADEPTGSLDSTNGELVMELLVSTARRQGSSIVLVTHEPQVAAYADREIVVRDGRVAHAAALA